MFFGFDVFYVGFWDLGGMDDVELSKGEGMLASWTQSSILSTFLHLKASFLSLIGKESFKLTSIICLMCWIVVLDY